MVPETNQLASEIPGRALRRLARRDQKDQRSFDPSNLMTRDAKGLINAPIPITTGSPTQ